MGGNMNQQSQQNQQNMNQLNFMNPQALMQVHFPSTI